jgi:hypothetical protein
MAILLHDGLCWTYRTSICHVLPHGTTGRLGLAAFFGDSSELWQFPVSELFSPQPPVTQAVGRLSLDHRKQIVTISCSVRYKDGFGSEVVVIEKRTCRCIRA